MRKIKYFFILTITGLLISCTKDFEATNTNPNVPTAVNPDLLLSGVIRNTLNDQVNEAWSIGNTVAQHTAKIQFVNDDRYLWGDRDGVWSSVYGNMRNLQNIIGISSSPDLMQNNYLGIALVLKSWLFSIATDTYGDIPYSEANKGKISGIYTAKYDKQEDIYNGILADLKKANEILGTSNETVGGDLLYGGGAAALLKWRKLANSLRVRYLIRLSKKKNVSTDLQAIIGSPAQNPLFANNDDNAELKYLETAPNQWPLYGSRVGSIDEFRVSKALADRLTALGDPRLKVFGRYSEKSVAAGAAKIEGIPNGLGDVAALNYNGGPQGVSRIGLSYACLVCNDNGPAPVSNVAKGILMTYAELQFLLAEAKERALITSGETADAYYKKGIDANIEYHKRNVPVQYNIDLTLPANYFTQAGVAYTGTQAEKLYKIATQKWIALFFNGLEAWFDWRRTGMPEIVPGPGNLNSGKVPIRYPYPLSEQSLNMTNRAEAVTRQGGTDDINTKIWLLQ